ncbi:MAG: CDP-alcohol phosphatidyltransferase family protein [Clostridium sartagoforme]|nr:CDP-alcohol phosphatidyltransferase family protein [Clostridium sartagoforme]
MKIKSKFIPNFITLIRIIGTFVIIFTKPFSTMFFIFYFLCGLSDVLDGYIARKFKLCSKLGAILDSLADAFLIIIAIIKVLPRLELELWMIVWIGFIFIIKVLSLIIGFLKFNEVAFLHTYANKSAGIFLFFAPLIYKLVGINISIAIVCSLSTVAALEEILINSIVKNINLNIKGILMIYRSSYRNYK